MTMLQHSICLRALLALWAALRTALCTPWPHSLTARCWRGLEEAMDRALSGSLLIRALSRESGLDRAWPDSLTARVCSALGRWLPAPFRALYRAAPALWEGSLLFRLLSGLSRYTSTLLGLLALSMLVVPHARWNNLYGFLGAAAIAALFVLGAGSERIQPESGLTGPRLPVFFLFVLTAFAGSLSLSLSLRFFLFHLTGLCFALLLVSSVQRVEQVQRTVGIGLAGLFVACLYGCVQGIRGVAVVASQQDLYLNAGMPGRVYSFFDNPNNFAELIVMLLPLALGLLLHTHSRLGRLACIACLGMGLAAIGYTYSRSGWLGLALAVFVFLALQERRMVPLAIVGVLLALPLLPRTILNRVLTIGDLRDSSTTYRFSIYEASFTLLEDYWFQGVGLGSDVMTQAFREYPPMFDGNHPIHTHNNYLQMLAELGLAGALAYLWLVLGQLKTGIRAFYTSTDARLRSLLAAAVGAFCGILLIGVAEYTWFYPRNMFLFWFLFGIIGACIKLAKKEACA